MSVMSPQRSSVSARPAEMSPREPVSRRMTWFGLIGGPLGCVSGIAVMFGAFEPSSVAQGIATIPEIIWEAFLGLYLTLKGFNMASPVFDGRRDTEGDANPAIASS
jgi:hypothetical protein